MVGKVAADVVGRAGGGLMRLGAGGFVRCRLWVRGLCWHCVDWSTYAGLHSVSKTWTRNCPVRIVNGISARFEQFRYEFLLLAITRGMRISDSILETVV